MIHPTEQKLRDALDNAECRCLCDRHFQAIRHCNSRRTSERWISMAECKIHKLCTRCAALAEPPIEMEEERKSGPSYFSTMKVRYVTPWKEAK